MTMGGFVVLLHSEAETTSHHTTPLYSGALNGSPPGLQRISKSKTADKALASRIMPEATKATKPLYSQHGN